MVVNNVLAQQWKYKIVRQISSVLLMESGVTGVSDTFILVLIDSILPSVSYSIDCSMFWCLWYWKTNLHSYLYTSYRWWHDLCRTDTTRRSM